METGGTWRRSRQSFPQFGEFLVRQPLGYGFWRSAENLRQVYGRVARSLLDMSEMEGEIKIIRNKVSRQDLAKVVGASREMVSRVMKDLEERGIIETQEDGSLKIQNHTRKG